MIGYIRKHLKKLDSLGFTLMELMIVLAVIAILVAVSIPIFSAKLEKTREAADIANMRAAKSAAVQFYYEKGLRDIKNQADFDKSRLNAMGLSWWEASSNDEDNVFGVYDIKTGKFMHWDGLKSGYGRGTPTDGGMQYQGYDSQLDYRNGAINVSFHTNASRPFIRIAWKTYNKNSGNRPWIRNKNDKDHPKEIIYIDLN